MTHRDGISYKMTGEKEDRSQAIEAWLVTLPGFHAITQTIADASDRRYFRVRIGDTTYMAMDMPPTPQSTCAQFVFFHGLLQGAGLHVPDIIASRVEDGFLLLTDVGSQHYQDVLTQETADELYSRALDAIVIMQVRIDSTRVPLYSLHLLMKEMKLFETWYVGYYLNIAWTAQDRLAFRGCCDHLARLCRAQPYRFVHRDFHSRNLMVHAPSPAILDFQDAVSGPLTYDVVSLLRDAYVSWSLEQERRWVCEYWEKARGALLPVAVSMEDFYRSYVLMGIQRHLKILGIFAHLATRGKRRYLADMERVRGYLQQACDELNEWNEWSDLSTLIRPLLSQPCDQRYSLR